MELCRTASRLPSGVRASSLAVLHSWNSSHEPFIMLHFCHESFSALCAVILPCTPRQDRVAFLTIWSRPIPAGCTGSGCRRLLQWYTLLLVLHHLHAGLLESVSTVHPRLRSTRPRQTVLGSVFRLIASALTTPVVVPMYISLVPNLSPRNIPLTNFAPKLFPLPRALSNTHSLKISHFLVRLASGSRVSCPPVAANFKQ